MDYEKFANTLNKFKIEVSFTKDSSNIEVDPVIYKEILNFALIKDSQKVMKLKDCVEHHTAL